MPHNGYDINSESLKRWIKAFKVQFSLTRLHQLDSDARKSENQTLLAAPIPSRGRKAASWWPLFAEEIAVYVHEVGIPGGVASEGQGEVIDAVLQRLSDRGIEASRTTIQPVVQAIIDRLRAAGK